MANKDRKQLINLHSSYDRQPVGRLSLGEIGVAHPNVTDAKLFVETVDGSNSASTLATFITEIAINNKISNVLDIVSRLADASLSVVSGDTIVNGTLSPNGSGQTLYLTHKQVSGLSNGFKKIEVDGYGHVTGVTDVNIDDISGLTGFDEAVLTVFEPKERAIASALNDLNSRTNTLSSTTNVHTTQIEELSARTTDLSNYYTKTEIDDKHFVNSGDVKTQVEAYGYTTNTGTIEGVNMNGASKGTSGVVDLGTVVTGITLNGSAQTVTDGAVTLEVTTEHAKHALNATNGTATTETAKTITYVESIDGTPTPTDGDLSVSSVRKTVTLPSTLDDIVDGTTRKLSDYTLLTDFTAHTGDTSIHFTTGDVKTQIEAYNYITSADAKTQIEAYNYITSADTMYYFDDAEYVSSAKTINFKHGNTVLTTIDATDFIKDGMVSAVTVDTPSEGPNSGVTCLIVTFNTDAGKEDIEIPVSDMFDSDLYYTKDEIHEKEKVVASALNDLNNRTNTLSGNVNNIMSIVEDLGNVTEDIAALSASTIALSASTVNIESGLTMLSGAVVENYYTKKKINNKEIIISAALNDLNDRVINVSASTEEINNKIEELSGRTVDLSGYYTSAQTDNLFLSLSSYTNDEKVISAALNVLNDKAISARTDINNLSAITTELQDNVYTKQEIGNKERVISAALNELNDRIDEVEEAAGSSEALVYLSGVVMDMGDGLDELYSQVQEISGRTVDMSGYYTSGETDAKFMTIEQYASDERVIAAAFNDLNSRLSGITQSEELVKKTDIITDRQTLSGTTASGSVVDATLVNQLIENLIERTEYEDDLFVISKAFNDLNDRVSALENIVLNPGTVTTLNAGTY